mmetsp:Transcript_16803/g.52976  ORF Transcript_16803/g.52976 Transcript_16803/m.52976 type:complete len:267 (-) Transcript_16803:1445-2245(-)
MARPARSRASARRSWTKASPRTWRSSEPAAFPPLPAAAAAAAGRGGKAAGSLDLHVLGDAFVQERRAEARLLAGLAILPVAGRQDLHQDGAGAAAFLALLVCLAPRLLELLLVLRSDLVQLRAEAHADLHQRAVVQLHPVHVQERLADAPRHKRAPVGPQRLLVLPLLLVEALVHAERPLHVGVLHQQAAVEGAVDVEGAADKVPAPDERRFGQARVQHAVEFPPVAGGRDILEDDDPEQLELHPHAALGLVVEVQLVIRHLVLED